MNRDGSLVTDMYGGERGIRTLAPFTQSNPLAEGPLEPLGYLSKSYGSPNRTRTCDNSINSRVLYQLSYQGTLHALIYHGRGRLVKVKKL